MLSILSLRSGRACWALVLAWGAASGAEIATGKMLGGAYEPRAFYIRGGPAQPWTKTYTGPRFRPEAAGRLMNLRIAQGIYHDEWLTETPFDAEQNTSRLIEALDAYREHGILAITVSLQGGNQSYGREAKIPRDRDQKLGPGKGAQVSAFRRDGSLKPEWMNRLLRLQRETDQRGMVLGVIYFYAHQDEVLENPAAIDRATALATDWLIDNDCRNVIIEIANEHDVNGFDHERYIHENIGKLIALARSRFSAKKAAFRLPVGASTGGSMRVFDGPRIEGDLTMIHGNNRTPEEKRQRIAELHKDAAMPGPIYMNEDDNGRETTLANLKRELDSCSAVWAGGGSWGYMPWVQAQVFPFRHYRPGDFGTVRDDMPLEIRDPAYFKAVLEHVQNLVFTAPSIPRYEVLETAFEAKGKYSNPYTEAAADAVLTAPGGRVWRIPLFWDGGQTWKMRVSPDRTGLWRYRIDSKDPGLNAQSGRFECRESFHPGGIRRSARWPNHFERQNGSPFWFLGDTAWAYFTDNAVENHNRAQAEIYAKARASQGFNVIHSMMLSEAGDGNSGGLPFGNLQSEEINPGYWQEVDRRLRFANGQGLTVGLAIAWGDKRRQEPFAWRMFPSAEARKRYARYIAARYSAFDVYFLVSGEWHAEIRARDKVTDEHVFREFGEIGAALAAADPHHRMIGIHPMTDHGSVREFAGVPWMQFGDYQQNYRELHRRVLLSRGMPGPVVNSEYAYLLRDQDGDGRTDKDNSYSTEEVRHASWDIAMAGGYLVTGFGSTYFGGRRNPGPFDPDAAKNREWEEQAGHLRRFFEQLPWWTLTPADELISAPPPRGPDVFSSAPRNVHPPQVTYWALSAPGNLYVGYVRGLTGPARIELGARRRRFHVWQFDPRTGESTRLADLDGGGTYSYSPPDARDWVFWLQAVPAAQYRVLVSTDLGGDPDDIQSLYRLLHYSDILRVEGIVSSPGPGAVHSADKVREWIRKVEIERMRRNGYPELMREEELLAMVKQGAADAGAPAPGRRTAGSDLIIQRTKEGAGPLWVLVWGSATDVAQALHDDPSIADRIRIYSIGSNNTRRDMAARQYIFDGLASKWPKLWWIESGDLPLLSRDTFRGVYRGGDQSGEWEFSGFVERNIRPHGGPGAAFPLAGPKYTGLKEGDSPSMLYLLSPVLGGTGDVNDPAAESWGGRFRHYDRHRYPNYYVDLDTADEAQSSISKWRVRFLTDWKARWRRYGGAIRNAVP